jgi:hypothetical protein
MGEIMEEKQMVSEEDIKKAAEDQLKRIEDLSQKIFGKPSKDIKFLLLTNFIHRQLIEEEITRTGLYQWLNVFNGEVKYPRDIIDYNKYDIIQVNMSPQDLHEIYEVRKALGPDTRTKLVVNNDFTSELWQGNFDFPAIIEQTLQNADMVFGTEYYQASALTELLQRKVYIIPHPADTKRLKALTPLPKKDIISCIWRRYDCFSYVPSLVVRGHGLTTQLIGYEPDKDPRMHLTTTLYDFVYSGTNYWDFCDQMRIGKIVYDPFTFHSYSRTTVDTAAMGIPVVGSNRTQSVNICYPHTAVDPYDVKSARELIQRLLNDKEFYDLVVKTALENVEFYNHTNSKERYLLSLYDAISKRDENFIKTDIPKPTTETGLGTDVLYNMSKLRTKNDNKEEELKKKIKGES